MSGLYALFVWSVLPFENNIEWLCVCIYVFVCIHHVHTNTQGLAIGCLLPPYSTKRAGCIYIPCRIFSVTMLEFGTGPDNSTVKNLRMLSRVRVGAVMDMMSCDVVCCHGANSSRTFERSTAPGRRVNADTN